jgi:hypothetical protein
LLTGRQTLANRRPDTAGECPLDLGALVDGRLARLLGQLVNREIGASDTFTVA